jgi:hypothetical protein
MIKKSEPGLSVERKKHAPTEAHRWLDDKA